MPLMLILRTVTIGFVLSFTILLSVIVVTYYNNKNIIDASQLIQHTHRVLFQSEEIVALTIDMETGYRGYFITHNESFLEPMNNAAKLVYSKVDTLGKLVADNKEQKERVDSVKESIMQRLRYSQNVIQLLKAGKTAEVNAMIATGTGKKLSDKIRRQITQIQTVENALLQNRQRKYEQRQRSFYAAFLGLTLVVFSVLGLLFYIITRNMEARNKVETELRENRNLLNSIINNTSMWISAKDRSGKFILVNKAMADNLGKQPVQLIGLTHYDIAPKAIADESEKTDVAVMEQNKLLEVEINARDRDGRMRSIYIVKFPIHNEKGEVTGMGGVAADMTERKENELKLQEAFEHINDLYNHAPCGYHSINANGIFTEINQTELNWLGYTKAEVVNKLMFTDILTNESKATFSKNFEGFKKTGKANNLEFELKRKNGSTFYVILNATAIYDGEGNYLYSRSTIHDITELKIAREEAEYLNQQLEQKIMQLEESNTELNTFTYSASHDLRAPLRAISSYASIISSEYSNNMQPDFVRMLDIVKGNAKKMAQLIDDLLVYSRIGKAALNFGEIELTSLAGTIAEELKETYTDKWNAKITFGGPRVVVCDAVLIRQVLANLIGNAIKYSANNPNPLIHFGWYHMGNETVFFVKDNGSGFDMKYAHKLFGVFQRLHSDKEFEGTGVGLAIVHRIIQKHSGRVWAEGKVDEGATFYFSIPDIKE